MVYEPDLIDFDLEDWLNDKHNYESDDDSFILEDDSDLEYKLIRRELEEFYSDPDNLLFDSEEI